MASLPKEFCILFALAALGCAYSVFGGLAAPPWAERSLGPGEIHYDDAVPLDPIWVDARDSEAYAEGHIEGAIRLTESNWEQGVGELMTRWLPDPGPIVVYCGDEACGASGRIAGRLRVDLPDAEIHVLKGGWRP